MTAPTHSGGSAQPQQTAKKQQGNKEDRRGDRMMCSFASLMCLTPTWAEVIQSSFEEGA